MFTSPVKGDEIGCLSAAASSPRAFAASFGGSIYQFQLTRPTTTISPALTVSGAYYVACATSPDGSEVYLLDTQAQTLSLYQAAATA